MTKIISLNQYIANKNKHNKKLAFTQPIWFNEISNGIKSLALRDQEKIFDNVRCNYINEYIYYTNIKHISMEDYSFMEYLKEIIDLEEPFDIEHDIEFSKGHDFFNLSKQDWENIADLIVRISLGNILNIFCEDLDPMELALEYDWDTVKIDYTS